MFLLSKITVRGETIGEPNLGPHLPEVKPYFFFDNVYSYILGLKLN